MIYIATVHFRDDMWVLPQRKYLLKNLNQPFKVFSIFQDIDFNEYRHDMYNIIDNEDVKHLYKDIPGGMSPRSKDHGMKLNFLFECISKEAKDDDIVIFLDGDAFPISEKINEILINLNGNYNLIAMQTLEDNYLFPHNAFTACKVGFWKRKCTWSFEAYGDHIIDIGVNLLNILKDDEWMKLNRTNVNDLHELFFGIYGDVIYHHGAGFRPKVFRKDLLSSNLKYDSFQKSNTYNDISLKSDMVYDKINNNFNFWKEFL